MKRIDMTSREASKYRALNRMAETVALRDLNLLKIIDQTVDSLREDKAAMDVLADEICREILRVKDYHKVLDEDGSIVAMLERTRDSLDAFHKTLLEKCDVARNARELHPDDGVVEAYCETIDSAARLHNAFNDLCWAIGEHDVDAQNEWSEPFESAKDMFRALKA
jgi:hypothetical protein